jgi:hypothetical protein
MPGTQLMAAEGSVGLLPQAATTLPSSTAAMQTRYVVALG